MALRWLEGFDANTTPTTLYGRLYDGAASFFGVNFGSENGANVTADEAVSSDENILVTEALVAAVANTWIIGFAFRADDNIEINDGAIPYVALGNVAGEQVRIEFIDFAGATTRPNATNFYKLRIMRGVTEIATSVEKFPLGVLTDDLWNYFQFKITVDNSAGSVEGRWSWVQKSANNPAAGYTTLTWDAAVTSVDTQNEATVGADRFTLSFDSGNTSDAVAFDDVYVCDSSGSKNNDFLGKIVIQRQTIDTGAPGDGDTTDWTLAGGALDTEDAFQEVSHSTINDDKRVTSDTIGQIHLAAMDPLPAIISAAPIVGMRVDMHGKMETSGSLSIGMMWRKTTGTPAQIEQGTALVVSSTTTVGRAYVEEDDPNTGVTWVNADIDVMQLGVKNNG